jgi:hypothetical protein
VVNIANVPSRENSAALRQRAAEGRAPRHKLGKPGLGFLREDGLPYRFVSTRARSGRKTHGTLGSLDRGEQNNESKIGKNYLLRSKYPQSEDHAIAAFECNDVAPECRFIYDPF